MSILSYLESGRLITWALFDGPYQLSKIWWNDCPDVFSGDSVDAGLRSRGVVSAGIFERPLIPGKDLVLFFTRELCCSQ